MRVYDLVGDQVVEYPYLLTMAVAEKGELRPRFSVSLERGSWPDADAGEANGQFA